VAQFPWQFTAQMQLHLQGRKLQIVTTIRNDDSTDLPFALGFHPYFAVADKSKVKVPTTATRCFNNVSKRHEAFNGFDFAQAELDVHLLDHNGPGVLDRGDARIEIRASDEFGTWVVWSLADKPYVCLEPWTAPGNALNSGECVLSVKPGATSTLSLSIACESLP
jgi:galactose mutarotase-like enzyme